jgi:hypothetical protein
MFFFVFWSYALKISNFFNLSLFELIKFKAALKVRYINHRIFKNLNASKHQ